MFSYAGKSIIKPRYINDSANPGRCSQPTGYVDAVLRGPARKDGARTRSRIQYCKKEFHAQ